MHQQKVQSPRISHLSWGRMVVDGVGVGKDLTHANGISVDEYFEKYPKIENELTIQQLPDLFERIAQIRQLVKLNLNSKLTAADENELLDRLYATMHFATPTFDSRGDSITNAAARLISVHA